MRQLMIRAEWDPDAEVWVATSDDVPGLVTEAATQPELIEKLKDIVPEMLELNGQACADDVPEVPVHLQYDQNFTLRV